MSMQAPSQLSRSDTLHLLFTYGGAYEYYRAQLSNKPDSPGASSDNREAARWAAAAAVREHSPRPRRSDADVFRAEGPNGLDGFVVALAARWAQHVAEGSYGVSRLDAEDIAARVGERLLKVMKRAWLGAWMAQPPAPPALGDWARTAVYNEILNSQRYRKRHPETPIEFEHLLAESESVESTILASDFEFVDLLARASTDVLTPADQRVLTMVSRLDMTQVEAAHMLGVSPQAVNQRLGRIRDKAPALAQALLAS
jgi:RNA polymerase sigma factor (sigma-70 family)